MRLMDDPALINLVAKILNDEFGEEVNGRPHLILSKREEVARQILDGLQMMGVPSRLPAFDLPEAPGYSAPAVSEGPVAPALRLSYCAMCLQEAANRRGAGLEPLTVHPAVTVIAGNAVCNVDGRHKIVAATAHILHQAGHLPPDNPFRRTG